MARTPIGRGMTQAQLLASKRRSRRREPEDEDPRSPLEANAVSALAAAWLRRHPAAEE